jgi:hypothetical protein
MTIMDKTPEARPGSLENAGDAAVTWRYLAPGGHTLEMCQRPDYWRNCSREVGQQRVLGRHAWNRIEIISEDGTWEAELRVLSVANGLVQTRLLREWTAPQKPGRKPNVPDGYKVEHISGNGWRALDAHGAPVVVNQTTEDDALRAAYAHAKQAKGG